MHVEKRLEGNMQTLEECPSLGAQNACDLFSSLNFSVFSKLFTVNGHSLKPEKEKKPIHAIKGITFFDKTSHFLTQ